MSALGANRTRRDGGNDVNDSTRDIGAGAVFWTMLRTEDASNGRGLSSALSQGTSQPSGARLEG
jgi:hypothetical protein